MPGFPQLGSNAVYGEDINPTVGIVVTDANALPSALVISQNEPFNLAVELDCDGFLATFLQGFSLPFTINYFAESLSGSPSSQIATANLNTNQGTAGTIVVYPTNLTQVTIPANTLTPGVYNLTVTHSFNGALPFSAFITNNKVIEVF